jgi:putative ABC transport system permease protein
VPAAPEAIGLVATAQPNQAISQAAFRRSFATLPRSPSGRVFFERPIYTELAASEVLSRARKPRPIAVADVVSRSSFCEHLVFAAGICPTRSNEIALSTRSASYLHIALDQIVGLSLAGTPRRYRVAGLYRPGSSSADYWWGTNYFEFGSALRGPPRLDAIFVNASALAGLSLAEVTPSADVPVNAGGLLSTELPAFRVALGSEELQLGRAGLQATSRIGGLLADVASQQQAMTTTIAVIDLQLLLLVLMVLFGIAGRTAAERYQDLALADLRGLSPASLWTVALREPFILIVAAAPIGAALGWLAALAIGHAELRAGVPVAFDSLAFAAAAAASVAALGATAAGSARVLRRSAGRGGSGHSRLGTGLTLAGEAFAVAVALAAVVQLSASGVGKAAATQPLAALAPGLIALAAGVIAARLVPLACRALAAAVRFSPRVGLALALQRVARQSGVIRQSVIIAIAVSLACFAIGGYEIDRQNRSIESAFLVGASRVLTVSVPASVDLEQAVRKADPSGRLAMAAEWESNSQGTLLAVDASRFSRVAAWPSQPGGGSPAAIASFLDPPVAPAVTVRGTSLRLRIDLLENVTPRPSLVVKVFNEQYGALGSINVGPLDYGTHQYTSPLQGDCTSACRLLSVAASWSGPEGANSYISVVIQHMDEQQGAFFRPVAAGLSDRGRWQVTSAAPGYPSSAKASPSGLSVVFEDVVGQTEPDIAPADVPNPLPAVVTGTVASLQATGSPTGSTEYSILDLDGTALTVNGAVQVAALPAVGTNAVMIDLDDALRDETLPDDYSTKQVWLSAAAGSGAAIISRLRAERIGVLSVRTAQSMEQAFEQDGPTLAFELFLVVGLASALLATGSLLFAVAVVTRQRAIEAVALRSVGVPRRTLVRAMAGELGIVVATGIVTGTIAGILAARFSLPSVPEFTGLQPGPTLVFGLPVADLAAVVIAAAVLLAVAAAVSIGVVLRASTPDKLRISQR